MTVDKLLPTLMIIESVLEGGKGRKNLNLIVPMAYPYKGGAVKK
jgi:hypothetical protein